MQGALTVGHCGGVGNAQKTACFGCLDPDNLSLSFRFSFVCFFDEWKLLAIVRCCCSFFFGLGLLEGVAKILIINTLDSQTPILDSDKCFFPTNWGCSVTASGTYLQSPRSCLGPLDAW